MAAELIETSDMKVVHGAFRSTLSGSAALVTGAAPGDVERAGMVANFYDNVLDFLDAHHNGEDELIWPRLIERCPADADRVRTIASQHDEVVDLLGRARRQLADWAATADPAAAAEAAATLTALDTTLAAHMDVEEAVILPLAAAHMSAAEWGELPGHGFAHFRGDKPWVVLGLIFEQAGSDGAAAILAEMPPPAREMWTGFGKSAYDALRADLGRT